MWIKVGRVEVFKCISKRDVCQCCSEWGCASTCVSQETKNQLHQFPIHIVHAFVIYGHPSHIEMQKERNKKEARKTRTPSICIFIFLFFASLFGGLEVGWGGYNGLLLLLHSNDDVEMLPGAAQRQAGHISYSVLSTFPTLTTPSHPTLPQKDRRNG